MEPLCILLAINNNMNKYTLSTPWDITTISSTPTSYDLGQRLSI